MDFMRRIFGKFIMVFMGVVSFGMMVYVVDMLKFFDDLGKVKIVLVCYFFIGDFFEFYLVGVIV